MAPNPVAAALLIVATAGPPAGPAVADLPPLPASARLVLDEDRSEGRIDPRRWYAPRKRGGAGNNGVVPENVRVERDTIDGAEKDVLVCEARVDRNAGPMVGRRGGKTVRPTGDSATAFLADGQHDSRSRRDGHLDGRGPGARQRRNETVRPGVARPRH